ncbi:MAG: hypothetical protein AAB257_06515 [Nitrospinota bacterium]
MNNTGVIEGMNRDTTLRYVEARKKIDTKLCQLISQGEILSALSEANIDLIHVSYAGHTIGEMAGDILGMLDDFIGIAGVHLELKEYDNGKDRA